MNVSWKLDHAVGESACTGAVALLPAPASLPIHAYSSERNASPLPINLRQTASFSRQVPAPTTVSGSQSHGRHHIRVCRGIACNVKGSAAVLDALQRDLGISPGNITPDGNFSLEVVACLDVCGMAPVIAVNEQLYPGVTPHQVEDLIATLKKEGESHG